MAFVVAQLMNEWAYFATGVQIKELWSKVITSGDTFRAHYVHIQLN